MLPLPDRFGGLHPGVRLGEGGRPKNQVGYARDNIFKPRFRFATLEELNGWLEAECERRARIDRHPELREQTVWEVYEAERAALRLFAGPFDGFNASEVTVSATCLVNFDRNKYSAMAHAARKAVQVRAYADRIVVRFNGKVVAEHAPPIRAQPDRLRSLALPAGALRKGSPFIDWELPAALTQLRRRLNSGDESDWRFVRVLAMVLGDGLGPVGAPRLKRLGGTARLRRDPHIPARYRDPLPPDAITASPALTLVHTPVADFARYDRLRGDRAAP